MTGEHLFETIEAARTAMILGRTRVICPACGVRHGIAFVSQPEGWLDVDCACQTHSCAEAYMDELLQAVMAWCSVDKLIYEFRCVIRMLEQYIDLNHEAGLWAVQLHDAMLNALRFLRPTAKIIGHWRHEYRYLSTLQGQKNAGFSLAEGRRSFFANRRGGELDLLWYTKPIHNLGYLGIDSYAVLAVPQKVAFSYVMSRFAECFKRADFDRIISEVGSFMEIAQASSKYALDEVLMKAEACASLELASLNFVRS